jgi:hypothetical protein
MDELEGMVDMLLKSALFLLGAVSAFVQSVAKSDVLGAFGDSSDDFTAVMRLLERVPVCVALRRRPLFE